MALTLTRANGCSNYTCYLSIVDMIIFGFPVCSREFCTDLKTEKKTLRFAYACGHSNGFYTVQTSAHYPKHTAIKLCSKRDLNDSDLIYTKLKEIIYFSAMYVKMVCMIYV